jgi:hypothetical protein
VKYRDITSFQQYLDMTVGYLDRDRLSYPGESVERAQVEGELKCAYRLRTVYELMKREGKA